MQEQQNNEEAYAAVKLAGPPDDTQLAALLPALQYAAVRPRFIDRNAAILAQLKEANIETMVGLADELEALSEEWNSAPVLACEYINKDGDYCIIAFPEDAPWTPPD